MKEERGSPEAHEAFIKTLLREWAYARHSVSNDVRLAAFVAWLEGVRALPSDARSGRDALWLGDATAQGEGASSRSLAGRCSENLAKPTVSTLMPPPTSAGRCSMARSRLRCRDASQAGLPGVAASILDTIFRDPPACHSGGLIDRLL